MTTAYLFPGQGAEVAGMGADLDRTQPVFRQALDDAQTTLPFDLRAALYDAGVLAAHPDYRQATLVAYSVALYRLLVPRLGPAAVLLGLSLGEYGALIAGGFLTLGSGLRLTLVRGQAMVQACAYNPGGMLAVRTSDPALLAAATAGPEVWVANYNSPKQTVLGGSQQGLAIAQKALSVHGVRAMALPVGGAFHTPLMAPAASALTQALAATPMTDGTVPVLSTTTLKPFTKASLAQVLIAQMQRATNLSGALKVLQKAGVDCVVTLSPKADLGKLVRQTAPGMTIVNGGLDGLNG